jgi:secondary thiamine-phosphate synthase enzyme
MEILGRSSTFRHTTIRIETTQPTQFIDLTDEIEGLISESGIDTGLANVQTLHTTTAVIVNEREPLLLADVAAMLDRLAPRNASYAHDNLGLRTVNCVLGERPNGHSHCQAFLLGASVCLNVIDSRLQLGRWQRVLMVELDGPRTRDVVVLILGVAR